MGVPDHLLRHTVTLVRPAQAQDAYNNTTYDYGPAATRTVLAPGTAHGGVWLQQDSRSEQHQDGRDPLDQRWLLLTNYADVQGKDRLEWDDHPDGPVVFELDGPPAPLYTPAGFHHLEASLRIVAG